MGPAFRAPLILALGAASTGVGAFAAPVAAQTAAANAQSQMCRIYAVDGTGGQPQEVHADCRGRGVTLGPAETYETAVNPELQATLVDTRFRGQRQVWLISFQEDGQLLLEDVSGSIALSAGRGPMSDLRGLEIDTRGFARDGSIKVDRDPGAAPGAAGLVDIGERMALEHARRGGSRPAN
jgi:hypothetical protein